MIGSGCARRLLSRLGRLFFRNRVVGDFYCGLRGFRKDAYVKMELRTTGLEFATEMAVKAPVLGMKITEVPTTLSPDGRSRLHTCERGVTAGVRCVFFFSILRVGYFSIPDSRSY